MTPSRDDNAAFAPSSSCSSPSPPPPPRARSTSTSTSTSRTTAGSTSTHTSAPSLASPTSASPAASSSHPPDDAPRKGRWTAAEHAELLLTGDAAPPGASWDALRRRMAGDARLRSATALRARYLQLVRERREAEEEEERAGAVEGGGGEADLWVEERDEEDVRVPEGRGAGGARETSWSPPGTQSDEWLPSKPVDNVHPTVSALPEPPLFLPPMSPLAATISPSALSFPPAAPLPLPLLTPHDPYAPPPWSIDEDTALLTAMATPQLGAQTWAGMHALAARVYRLGPGQGREWTRSERDVQRRWDSVLRDGQFAPLRWPDALVPALVAIHAVLTESLQAQLDATNPRLAASLRDATLPRPPGPAQPAHPHSPSPATAAAPKPKPLGSPIRVKPPAITAAHHSPTASLSSLSTARRSSAPHLGPSPSPHPARAQGRAAPPFPARNSPLPGPSALPLPIPPSTSPYMPRAASVARPDAPQQQPAKATALYQARPLPLSMPLGAAYHPPSSLSSSTSLASALSPSTPGLASTSTPPSSSSSTPHAYGHAPHMRLGPAPPPLRPYGVLDVERAVGLGHGLGLGLALGLGGELVQGGQAPVASATASTQSSGPRSSYNVGASWSAIMGAGAGAGAGAGEGAAQGRKRALSVSAGAGGSFEGWWWDKEEDGDEGSAAKKARRESA